MTRPRGMFRTLLHASAWEAAATSPWGAASLRDAMQRAGVANLREARTTWDNMVRAGELRVVGFEPLASHGRPMRLCVPVTPATTTVADAVGELQRAMLQWAQQAETT